MKFLSHCSRLLTLSFAAGLATFHSPAHAARPPDALSAASDLPQAPARRSPFVGFTFSLLPRSLQLNPTMAITVLTELTPDGKMLPPASPQNPTYYVSQSGGMVEYGAQFSGEKKISPPDMEAVLFRSLAQNGYKAHKGEPVQPSLIITYFWGTHNLISHVEYGPGENPHSRMEYLRNFLERAALVGGSRLARRLSGSFDDIHNLQFNNPNIRELLDHASDELYFVVASAYDYPAAAQNRRKLLWRTRITVSSSGVSMKESIPQLVMAAAPFFGRETTETEIVVRKFSRAGRVDFGTPTVTDDNVPVDPAAQTKPADSKPNPSQTLTPWSAQIRRAGLFPPFTSSCGMHRSCHEHLRACPIDAGSSASASERT